MVRRWVRLFPFPFAHIRFCSEGILDKRVRVLKTNQAGDMLFVIKSSYELTFVYGSS
jgi:hypothetical protein